MGPSKLAGNWAAKRRKRARAEYSRFNLPLPLAVTRPPISFVCGASIVELILTFSTALNDTCRSSRGPPALRTDGRARSGEGERRTRFGRNGG